MCRCGGLCGLDYDYVVQVIFMVQVVFVVLVAQVVLVGYVASEAQQSWIPRAMDQPEGPVEPPRSGLASLVPPVEPLVQQHYFCSNVSSHDQSVPHIYTFLSFSLLPGLAGKQTITPVLYKRRSISIFSYYQFSSNNLLTSAL